MIGIALFIASRFAVIGAALALWAGAQAFALPLLRAGRYLLASPQLRSRRRRALGVAAAAAAVACALLFALPLPYATVGEGVVWVPDAAILRSGAEGFVRRFVVAPGGEVAAGQTVIELEDPVAASQVDVQRAELAVLEDRFTAVNLIDLVQARLVREQVERAKARLARAEERTRGLVVIATRTGRFVVPDAPRLIGRFVHQGDLLGYVIGPADPDIHVVIPQADIALVRERTRAVAIRFTERIGVAVTATILRETPAALDKSPAPALASEGGGPILLDPASPNHDRPLEKFYEVELTVADPGLLQRIGSRVFARFDHGSEPIAWRVLRSARQLLLRALNV
jgi:putative peptide zinc metalloprotease protein